MDINLPLILMIAVGFTGCVWLVDKFYFARDRMASEEALQKRYGVASETDLQNNTQYQQELEAVRKEPLVIEYSKSFFPVLALVFVLRSFLVEPFQIPSGSMIPTLEVGDFIVVNKFAYGIRLPVFRTKVLDLGQPKRGDVVVFFPPHEKRYFIKRLIGEPGDTIRYVEHTLYVNDVEVPKELVERDPVMRDLRACYGKVANVYTEELGDKQHLIRECSGISTLSRSEPWVVPEGHYFMMGDNRDNSADSRSPEWTEGAFVPDKNIVGKAFAIWLHKSDGWPHFKRAGKIE